ncbi:hypothetical protein D499_0X00660 [Hanseniaspora uvarum DSM 2768]|nr:hypothetical protein D499_0X00660 [Hanseniaspora uvarum DSM 2768]
MTTVNNYSFANNFYDTSLDTAFSSKNNIDAINFNGLDNLNLFITKSSAYINNLYDFFQEFSSMEKANLKRTAALIHKYEKTFTNKDTIPKNWYENVHDPLLQVLKNRNINNQKYFNTIENDVLYHLKTIQTNVDSSLVSSMLKLQSFKQNLIQSHTLIKTKSSKLEQSKIKLRQIDLNLQMANGPGYGEKQLQKLIKEQNSQLTLISDLENDIYVHKTDFDCLIKNYKDKWVEITESIQEEQFNRYQYCLELINNSFEKEFDNLMTQSLHDLELLKFKLINYDFEKDLKWLSYKFGTGYKNMSTPVIQKTPAFAKPHANNSISIDETYDNANNYIDKHITMGFNNQTTHDESYEETGLDYDDLTSFKNPNITNNTTYMSKQPLKNPALNNPSQFNQSKVTLGNLSEFDIPSGLEEVHLGPMRYSSLSSHAILNDDSHLSSIEHTDKNSFKSSGHRSMNTSDGENLSHKEQMRLMMKSVESIEGVNWRNRKQKIGQQKLKAPEVPEREKNLFWSEEEQDDDRVSENSSIDVTVKKTTQELKAANISDDLPQSYVKDDIEDDEISYEKSEMIHTSNKPAIDPQDDDSEEGDLTMLTNAVMKMKERQYKRKSILNDLGKMQTLDEPSQSTIKSLKVFVPHQR